MQQVSQEQGEWVWITQTFKERGQQWRAVQDWALEDAKLEVALGPTGAWAVGSGRLSYQLLGS